MKPPTSYPSREQMAYLKEAPNSSIRVTDEGTVGSLDISSGNKAILVTTSQNEIKILDG